MKYFAYNAFLRYSGMVDHPDDCPAGCELTLDEPPATPWPDGFWPYYMPGGWELAEVQQQLAG